MNALHHHNPYRPGSAVRHFVRGIGAAAILAVLVAGVPWTLLRTTDWPLTDAPSWEQVRDVPAEAASEAAIIGVFVVGLWAAWLVFTASVALEVIAQIRGSEAIRVPGAGPLQHAARNLVASIVMTVGSLGPLTTQRTTAAAHDLAPVAAVSTVEPAAPAPATRPDALHTATGRPITVARGDTAWDLAERWYGDGVRADVLWQDNRDRLQPDGRRWADETDPIEPGWVLHIRDQSASTLDEPELVTVQPGDSIWSIAEDGLGAHLNRPPAPAETGPYWQDTVGLNADHLASGDPNLIYPGEQIRLPPSPGTPSSPDPPPPDSADASPDADSPGPATDAPAGPTTTLPPPTTETTTTTAAPAPTTPSATAPAPPAEQPSPQARSDQEDSGSSSSIQANVPLRLAVGSALAALVLRSLARRRRARRRTARPGTTTGPRLADDIETERLLATAATDALDRAWQTARTWGDVLRAAPDTPAVTGLEVGPDGDVVVHLAEPAIPVEPFIASGGPAAWLLPADRGRATADTEPALETLVSLGHTADGDWVFVDLESLGATWVDGDPERSRNLVRSLTAELALQPLHHYVDVTLVGDLDHPQTTEQGVVTFDRLDDDLVHQFEQTSTETAASLTAANMATTAVARAHGLPRDGLVATVAVIGDDADPVLLDRLAQATLPGGQGVALISLEPISQAHQLAFIDDGQLEIPHMGLVVHPAGIDTAELRRIDNLLRHEPETVTLTSEPFQHEAQTEPAEPYEEPAWDYCVRVLADHQVDTPDGHTVSFHYGHNPDVPNKNTNRGPELVAYLALRHDRSATLDEIRDHLWWGRTIGHRSVDTLISGTRRVLGGSTYLTTAEGDPGRRRYQLAAAVVTDVELLEHALAYAQAIAEQAPNLAVEALRPYLGLIHAPAFRSGYLGTGLSEWAAAYRIVDRVEQPVIEAALLAADLIAAQGPHGISDAQWAIDQALRACPTNEALIRAGMELEARAGHREAAQHRYNALATHLALDELEPEPATTDLRNDIMRGNYRIG